MTHAAERLGFGCEACRGGAFLAGMNRVLLLWMLALPLGAAEVRLLDEGKAVHQIVLPDQSDSPAVSEGLRQTARLVQTAFLANGAEVGIVVESQRDPAKPGLWLGNTRLLIGICFY